MGQELIDVGSAFLRVRVLRRSGQNRLIVRLRLLKGLPPGGSASDRFYRCRAVQVGVPVIGLLSKSVLRVMFADKVQLNLGQSRFAWGPLDVKQDRTGQCRVQLWAV